MQKKSHIVLFLLFFLIVIIAGCNNTQAVLNYAKTSIVFPEIISSSINDGAVIATNTTEIEIRFSEPMDAKSLKNHFELNAGGKGAVDTSLLWSQNNRILTISFNTPLAQGQAYFLYIDKDSQSMEGFPMESPFRLFFYTQNKSSTDPTTTPTNQSPTPTPNINKFKIIKDNISQCSFLQDAEFYTYLDQSCIFMASGYDGVRHYYDLTGGNWDYQTIRGIQSYTGHIAITGTRLIAASDQVELSIFNIVNLTSIYKLGSFPLSSTITGLEAKDDLVFVSYEDRLDIIDISDPSKPFTLNSVTLSTNITKFKVYEKYCYILLNNNSLEILDLTSVDDTTLITPVNTITFLTNPVQIALNEKIAVIGTDKNRLIILNTADDITNPSTITNSPFNSTFDSIILDNNNAYILNKNEFIDIVNLTTPATPVIQTTLLADHEANDLMIHNDGLFVLEGESGYEIFNLNDLQSTPNYIQTVGMAFDLFVEDQYVYLSTGYSGLLEIIDYSDIDTARVVFEIPLISNREILVDDNYIYSLHEYTGLKISKKNNVLDALQYKSVPLAHRRLDSLLMHDGYLIVGTRDSMDYKNIYSTEIYDVKDPDSITHIASHPYSIKDMKISGNYLYATDDRDEGALFIFDITNGIDPENFVPVKTIPVKGIANKLAVYNEYVLVTSGANDLSIVTRPDNIDETKLLTSMTLPGATRTIDILDDHAFIAAGSYGVHIVDLKNINQPTHIKTITTYHFAETLTVHKNKVFVADKKGGLLIIGE